MDTLSTLAQSSLFRGSSPSDFEPLLPAVRIQTFEKGRYLWHTGDRPTSIHVLVSGQVNVSRLGPDGEEFVVDVFLPGDTLGELPIFEEGLLRHMECLAADPTVCLTIPREPLIAFLERHPRVLMKMLATLTRRIRNDNLLASERAFQNIAGRVACTLLHLAAAHGEAAAEGVRIPAQISQGTLANMVGASRENVNRAMLRLIRLGDVRRSRSTIVIPDLEELRRRYGWMVP